LGDLGCYSFHPRKVITTGEGGMIVTDDDVLADKIRILRTHGGVSNGLYSKYAMAGFNYRLSDILGAVGIAQMAKLPGLLEQRKQLASIYQSLLQDLELLHVPSDPDWGGHIYQSFVVLLDEEIDRDTIIQSMHAEGIETTLGTYALHMQPFYQQQFGYQNGDCPNSRIAFNHSLTLPLYPGMSLHDPEIVVQALSNSLDTTRQQKFHPIP
jgi:dTDP-4-amino-4,6-dideoxygalactose transaminase